MRGSFVLRALSLAVVLAGAALPAFSQTEERGRTRGYNAIIDNIDLLVENYTRFLARKYDLTEEQNEYTKQLLRERTYEFLDRHEEEARELVDRLFDVRTGGEMTVEELIDWGRRIKPIYAEAKRLITDGNDEWREILTEEQRKIHDDDLKLMYRSFKTTEDQLERMISGEMTVEEFRSPKRGRRQVKTTEGSPEQPPFVQDTRREPPLIDRASERRAAESEERASARGEREAPQVARRGAKLPRGKVAAPGSQRPEPESEARPAKRGRVPPARLTKKVSAKGSEGQWEKYVRDFIEKYKLNDEQAQKANAVLEDCKSQADRYLRGRKSRIEQLDKQIGQLKKSKDKNKAESLSTLTDKRKKLMEPIDRIFEEQLKPRLERLPTRAQRRAAEAAAKKPATKKTTVKKKTKESSREPDD